MATAPTDDPVSFAVFTNPANGTVAVTDSGLTYTPSPGFSGEDEFLVKPTDTISTLQGSKVLIGNLIDVRVHVEPTPIDDTPLPPLPPPVDPPAVALADTNWVIHAGEAAPLAAVLTAGASDVSSIQWDLDYDGVTFSPGSVSGTLTPSPIFSDPGIYVVAVQVTDSAGDTAMDEATVEVLEPDDPASDSAIPVDNSTDTGTGGQGGTGTGTGTNDPPFSPTIIAPSGSIHAGDWLTFGTSSGGGQAVTWCDWDFDYDGSHFNPSVSGLNPAHTFSAPGTYTVAVDASDDAGDDVILSTTVVVLDTPGLVIVPPADASVDEGDTATFTVGPILDLVGQPDNPAQLVSGQPTWDENFTGQFLSTAGTAGASSISVQAGPGDYSVAVRVTDNAGTVATAVVNLHVEALPPDVSAGVDQTVDAGSVVQFSGTASAPSGITYTAWDFNYDGTTFTPDATAAGSYTPTFTYLNPGTYQVAFEAVAGNGLSSMDVITITVNDVAPTGSVTLAPSEPDGSPQLLEDGSPIYFQVSGMGGTDPALPPSLWADWDGTGNYELIDSSELLNETTDPTTGQVTAFISHIYDDSGSQDPQFKIEDDEGLATPADVPVVLADVAPTATLVLPTENVNPGQVVTVSLVNVNDPSQDETDAGFTYDFQVKNPSGAVVATQNSDSPDLVLNQLAPGTLYTVNATVTNEFGAESQVYTGTFQVLSDQVVSDGPSSTGFCLVQWVTTAGQSGSYQLPPQASYQFVNEIANMSVTLMSDGATYDLATNFRFDAVEGQNFSNVTLTIGTDNFSNLPNVYGPNATQQTASVGDGFIGQVNIGGTNDTVSVYSRGDFQGLNAPNARAQVLSFINDLGSINADSAGNISCTGTLKNFGFAHGVDNIAANSVIVDGSCTRTDPNGINPTLTLTYRQNGGLVVTGNSNIGVTFGNQPRVTYQLDSAGRVVDYTGLPNADGTVPYVIRRYDPATGLVNYEEDRTGWRNYGWQNGVVNSNWVITSSLDYPPQPPSPPSGSSSLWSSVTGWAEKAWDGAVTIYSQASNAVNYAAAQLSDNLVINGKAVSAWADEQWTKAGQTVTWAYDSVNQAALYVGDIVVSASRQAADKFMGLVEKYGVQIGKLVTLLDQYGDAAASILEAIVANPGQFLTNLGNSLGKGITNFFNGLPTTLPGQVLQWITGNGGLAGVPSLQIDWTKSAQVGQWLLNVLPTTLPDQVLQWITGKGGLAGVLPLPDDWTDEEEVGPWLLKVMNLTWNDIQGAW